MYVCYFQFLIDILFVHSLRHEVNYYYERQKFLKVEECKRNMSTTFGWSECETKEVLRWLLHEQPDHPTPVCLRILRHVLNFMSFLFRDQLEKGLLSLQEPLSLQEVEACLSFFTQVATFLYGSTGEEHKGGMHIYALPLVGSCIQAFLPP